MSAIKKASVGLFSQLLGKREARQVLPAGYMPATKFSEEDVFIVGYPKSGNTWFQDLAAGVVFGALPAFAPPVLVQDLVPDVHAVQHYKRYATPMFFKSHALPTPDYKRVVYLLRDGRDAMVSYYHQLVVLDKGRVDFLEMVQSGKSLFPCKWHKHVEAWLDNPFEAQMIVIKYEELKKNTACEMQRFCDFVETARESYWTAIGDSGRIVRMCTGLRLVNGCRQRHGARRAGETNGNPHGVSEVL